MKRYKMPRKLKKAMKSTVRQYEEYDELFNKIYTAKGYDQIHFDVDDCESEEEADALRAENERLVDIVCKEVEAMIHHRKSKWQAKADAIMHDWEGDEDGSNVIIRLIWMGTCLDNKYFEFGNCFRTREEAEAAAERVKKALKGE